MSRSSRLGNRSFSEDSDAGSQLDFRPHPEDERGPLCPTCNGRGVVDKNESGTIALIPVSDSRLKPRRTILYVSIAVGISLIICFLVAFFVYERSITLYLHEAEISSYTHGNTSSSTRMLVRMRLRIHVKNYNYFTLSAKNLTLIVQNPQQIGMCRMPGKVSISARSTHEFLCFALLNLTDTNAEQIEDACRPGSHWRHFTFMFSTSLRWKYLTLDSGTLQESDWRCFTCHQHQLPNIGSKTNCGTNATDDSLYRLTYPDRATYLIG